VFPLAAFMDDIPVLGVEAKDVLKAIDDRYGSAGARVADAILDRSSMPLTGIKLRSPESMRKEY
jgi:hypothetical protein